jgi:HlyD family secretion protein
MTVTAEIIVKTVENALLVPNAALRFTPPEPEQKASESRGGLLEKMLPRPPGSMSANVPQGSPNGSKRQRVWIVREGVPVSIPLMVGVTDGKMTEVYSGDVRPGMPLIVDFVKSVK